MNPKNIRVKDIARLAGVSKGTVDRALHKRGRASQESYQKVMKVLQEIDYKPNLIARTLNRIVALLPNPTNDAYIPGIPVLFDLIFVELPTNDRNATKLHIQNWPARFSGIVCYRLNFSLQRSDNTFQHIAHKQSRTHGYLLPGY